MEVLYPTVNGQPAIRENKPEEILGTKSGEANEIHTLAHVVYAFAQKNQEQTEKRTVATE